MIDAESSLRELLGEAETDEDFAAVEELIVENETKNGTPKPEESRWVVRTMAELAAAMGFVTQTVYQWRADPTMPGKLGAFSVPEVVQWRLAKAKGGDLSIAKKEQDLELGKVELEKNRMELAKERGELLEVSAVELWASTALIEAREQIMQLPELLATSSPPELREFVRTEADRHCRDVLTALRRRLERDSIASDAAPGAAEASEVG